MHQYNVNDTSSLKLENRSTAVRLKLLNDCLLISLFLNRSRMLDFLIFVEERFDDVSRKGLRIVII